MRLTTVTTLFCGQNGRMTSRSRQKYWLRICNAILPKTSALESRLNQLHVGRWIVWSSVTFIDSLHFSRNSSIKKQRIERHERDKYYYKRICYAMLLLALIVIHVMALRDSHCNALFPSVLFNFWQHSASLLKSDHKMQQFNKRSSLC